MTSGETATEIPTREVATVVTKRIFLWSHPRNLATVFEKCVSCMDGAEVWNEPFTHSFLNHIISSPELLRRYPHTKNIIRVEDTSLASDGGNLKPFSVFRYDWVQEQLEKPLKKGKKFLFVKDVPLAIGDHFEKLPKGPSKHTFIIRNPLRSATSFRKLCIKMFHYEGDVDRYDVNDGNPFSSTDRPIPDPLYAFWQYVKDNIDPNPVVIDADDLQSFPEQILKKYCEAVGIPFKTSYLKWDNSKESINVINGGLNLISEKSHAYIKALSTSCFTPVTSPPPCFEELTPDEQKYCSSILKGYEEMYLTRLKPALHTV